MPTKSRKKTKKKVTRPSIHKIKHINSKRATFPIVLITLGVLLMGIWGIHRILYARSLTLSDAVLSMFVKEQSKDALPIHLDISENISLPIVESGKVDGAWAISQTSANHVRQSALPGQPGNIIIYAHNTEQLFGNLKDVKVGDIISIRTTDTILHRYKVISTQWVTPSHIELLTPIATETLTLYTCAGILDSLRVVVQAIPAE